MGNLFVTIGLFFFLSSSIWAQNKIYLDDYQEVPQWMVDKLQFYKDSTDRSKIMKDFEYDLGKVSSKSSYLNDLLEYSIYKEKLVPIESFFAEVKTSFDKASDKNRIKAYDLYAAYDEKKRAIGMGLVLTGYLFSHVYDGDYDNSDSKKYKKALNALHNLELQKKLYEQSLVQLIDPARDYYYFYLWILAELRINSGMKEAFVLKRQAIEYLLSLYSIYWAKKGLPPEDIVLDSGFQYLTSQKKIKY